MAKKEKREYKPKAWKGTIRAMITKHPDKFDPEASGKGPKLNPYAIATAMKKKDATPHYKAQKTTLKGKPVKKEKYKDEDKPKKKGCFSEWLKIHHPEFLAEAERPEQRYELRRDGKLLHRGSVNSCYTKLQEIYRSQKSR